VPDADGVDEVGDALLAGLPERVAVGAEVLAGQAVDVLLGALEGAAAVPRTST
jgi:hypothetical protein